ncbi:MAG: CPBP family intramembrane glutamic endopeptidase [Mobilitalea sp.]
MRKIWEYCKSILPFFAAEAIQYTVINLLAFAYSFAVGTKASLEMGIKGIRDQAEIAYAINNSLSPEIQYLFGTIAVLACGVVFYFWYRNEIRYEVKGSLENIFERKNVALLIMLGVGCQFFISGVMSLIRPYFAAAFADYATTMEGLTSGNGLVVLLLMVFGAPIAEELVFRGVILKKASRVITFMGANLLQALLFGVYHQNIVQGIYATVMGFLLGLIYHKYKSIIAPIFLHMIINVSTFLVILFPDQYVSLFIMTILGAVLVMASWYLLKPLEDSR